MCPWKSLNFLLKKGYEPCAEVNVDKFRTFKTNSIILLAILFMLCRLYLFLGNPICWSWLSVVFKINPALSARMLSSCWRLVLFVTHLVHRSVHNLHVRPPLVSYMYVTSYLEPPIQNTKMFPVKALVNNDLSKAKVTNTWPDISKIFIFLTSCTQPLYTWCGLFVLSLYVHVLSHSWLMKKCLWQHGTRHGTTRTVYDFILCLNVISKSLKYLTIPRN